MLSIASSVHKPATAALLSLVVLSARGSANAAADVTYHYAGTVVDDRGQPVSGARIFMDYVRGTTPSGGGTPLAVSDAHGRFEFSRRASDFSDAAAPWAPSVVIATKVGYGLAGAPSLGFETTGRARAFLNQQRQPRRAFAETLTNVLKLAADDVPIHGRVLDTEGRPVSGADVAAVGIWQASEGTLDTWEAAIRERGPNDFRAIRQLRPLTVSNALIGARPSIVPAVRTDAEGWFTLKGLGRERLANLLVSGSRVETVLVHVRSRRGDVIKLRREKAGRDAAQSEESFYPCEFTCIVGPSVPVEGRVTDGDSKEPVSDVLVRANRAGAMSPWGSLSGQFIGTKTDAQGRYRLEGLPLGNNILGVSPPLGSRYLRGQFEATTNLSEKPRIEDISLVAGVLVRGRVTDARTGKPVGGNLEYFAFLNNPQLKQAASFERLSPNFGGQYRSRSTDGVFEIPVLPGKGILTFQADDYDAYPMGAGADRIDGPKQVMPNNTLFTTAPHDCTTASHHLLAPLDPQPGSTSLMLDLTLRSGSSVTGKVLAADGQPLSDYFIYGEGEPSSWYWHPGQTFDIQGYFRSKPRRLMFYHPGKKLVGLHDLAGEPAGPLEIKLYPGGKITGRVLDSDGRPLENAQIIDTPPIILDRMMPSSGGIAARKRERGVLLRHLQAEGRQILTDSQGRFELPGIIPGLKYSAAVVSNHRFLGIIFTDVTAEPRETKQLGNLTLRIPEIKGRPGL